VLADWESLLGSGAFVKVMPHDYKRVLRELAEQEEAAAAGATGGARSGNGGMRTFVRGSQAADASVTDPVGAPQVIGEPGQEPA
jgi:hypothetical protein